MATTSLTALRRLAGSVFALMLLSLYLTGAAIGQAPAVTATAPLGLNHPTGWNTIQQTAIDTNGDWLVDEYVDGGLFEFPASGGPMVTLVPLDGLGGPAAYENSMVLLDPANNLYIGGNWNNCMLEFNYDAATGTWTNLSEVTPKNISSSFCNGNTPPSLAQYSIFGFSPYYFQPWGVAIGPNNTIIVGNNNNGFIFSMQIQNAWSNPSVTQSSSSTFEILASATKRPISIAVDPQDNIYFVEDSGGLPGVYEIPQSIYAQGQAAGTAGVKTKDTSAGIVRVDPNLPDVTGVATDAAGNLYISDGQDGVFMVPAATTPSGTPDTAAAVMLTPVPAQGKVAIDPARKILYVPTTQKQTSALSNTPPYTLQTSGQADVAKVGVNYAEFGASPVGTATAASVPVDFSFNSSVIPASFSVVEDGMTSPEFAITGGTCTVGTAYAAMSSCAENLTFTPSAVGSSSARLVMLDKNNNILASMLLHGTGLGANAQASPGVESVIGSTLQTPTQVTTDNLGNLYVADPAQGKVLEYAAGSSSSSTPVAIGTGWTNPTGVAVDGAGDVFVADSGTGTVSEVPFGPSGLNTAGQAALINGLGTSGLNLASDGIGDLYITDPTNSHVVKLSGISVSSTGAFAQSTTYLTTGASPSAPSAVAVDSSNNLYVLDSGTLVKFMGGLGAPTTVLSGLTGDTGIAVDPSGGIYLSSTSGGVTRVPSVNGTIAPDVTSSSSVAIDRLGNLYVAPSAGKGITVVSTVSMLNLGTPSSTTSSTSANDFVTNIGNAPLSITGYTNSTTVLDSVTVANFTGADGTPACVAGSPIAAGSACQVVVTFNLGPGQQGTLNGWVQATSNAINAPITIDTTGTGLALTNSQTQIAVGSNPQVIDTPVTVTVTPASGTGTTPTGTVQVSFTSWTVVVPIKCATPPCIPTINPVTVTAASTLDGKGTAQFTLAPVLAGIDTFTVGYTGDRTYGTSTGNTTATVSKSAIAGFIADTNPPSYLPFVEEGNPPSSVVPYDGSNQYWTYNMPVTVNTAIGIPTGTLTFNDDSTTCPSGTSASGVGPATCQLANYKGIACPQSHGAGVQYVTNNTTYTSAIAGATANFNTGCLQMPLFTTYTPVVSTHYITTVYSGDANFIGATDPASSVFQALPGPLVNITPSAPAAPSAPVKAASVTVQSGATANLTLYLAPLLGYGFQGKGGTLNNYNFPVTLTCDNLPPHTACTFAYPSITSSYQPIAPNSAQICPQPNLDSNSDTAAAFETLAENGGCNANGMGVVTLTINTNVAVGTTTSQNASAASVTLASIFGLGMMGLFFRRKAFQKGRKFLMVVLMIAGGALAVTLSACNTTNLTPLSQLSTPPGTYAVTITASQVGTQCVPKTGVTQNQCTTPSGGTGQLTPGSNNQVSLPYYINLTVQ